MGAIAEHKTSPFCWLEEKAVSGGGGDDEETKKTMTSLGGRDRLAEWAMAKFDETDEKNEGIHSLCKTEPTWKELKFDATTPGTAKTE